MNSLIDDIINSGVTKVTKERFTNILSYKDYINSLEGDIIECGVWKGGMSIFLTKIFPNKQIWIADSFCGFEGNQDAKYKYDRERHQKGGMSVSRQIVTDNFEKFDVDIKSVNILEGFVNHTLPDCGIGDIALLRVDVDAYSATLEVLENLYDKVVPGGLIVFDDTCLYETQTAINKFFGDKDIQFELKSPLDDTVVNINKGNLPCGCYMIKK